MSRKVFFSFHYQNDYWRVQQIMNMGAVEGQPLLGSQRWEDVARGGDRAIQAWIDEQLKGKSCNVVLIGSGTAGRKWINYEFTKAWGDGKGVVGIHIHRLLDRYQQPSVKGRNPFSGFVLNQGTSNEIAFDRVVPVYDPTGWTSADVYNTIKNNIESWVEHAISVRNQW